MTFEGDTCDHGGGTWTNGCGHETLSPQPTQSNFSMVNQERDGQTRHKQVLGTKKRCNGRTFDLHADEYALGVATVRTAFAVRLVHRTVPAR